jgi:hypothetical protein
VLRLNLHTNSTIYVGSSTSTTGPTGNIEVDARDTIEIVCIDESPLTIKWAVFSHHNPSGVAIVLN